MEEVDAVFTKRIGSVRRQDAAIHRDQVRSEDDIHRRAADVRQDLLDLRLMTVLADAIGRKTFIHFAVQHVLLRRSATA